VTCMFLSVICVLADVLSVLSFCLSFYLFCTSCTTDIINKINNNNCRETAMLLGYGSQQPVASPNSGGRGHVLCRNVTGEWPVLSAERARAAPVYKWYTRPAIKSGMDRCAMLQS